MSDQRYPYVHCTVPLGGADAVSAALFELGATGVEERDGSTLSKSASADVVLLVASYESEDAAQAAAEQLRDHDLDAHVEHVVGDGWRDAWKEHFKPFALTPDLLVVPPWEAAEPGDGQTCLLLEPGRAFGTGLHATTSLVATFLHEDQERLAGQTLLDLGTGSGILALVARRYGAGRLVAIDNDPDVLDVVRENAERNGMTDQLEVLVGSADTIDETFPWVLANIEARVLLPIAPDVVRRVEPGGTLILSGILAPEEARIIEAYAALGLTHDATKRRGQGDDEWVAIRLSRGA